MKKNDHQKKIVYQKDSLPAYKNNKSIYILGDSVVKHVEGWKLQKSIDKNVYVRKNVRKIMRNLDYGFSNFPCWNK